MRSLEALDITKDQLDGLLPKGLTPNMKWNIKTIEKELKALEIIKKKKVNVDNFLNHIEKDTDYKEYKRLCGLYKIMVFSDKELTQEEYELLKEVLLWN